MPEFKLTKIENGAPIFADKAGKAYTLGAEVDPDPEINSRNKVFYLLDASGERTGFVVKMPWLVGPPAMHTLELSEEEEDFISDEALLAKRQVMLRGWLKEGYQKDFVSAQKEDPKRNQLLFSEEGVPFQIMPDKGLSVGFYVLRQFPKPKVFMAEFPALVIGMVDALQTFYQDNPGYIRLDVKKENFCMTENMIRLIDFELRGQIGETGSRDADDNIPDAVRYGEEPFEYAHDVYALLHFLAQMHDFMLEEPAYKKLVAFLATLPSLEQYKTIALAELRARFVAINALDEKASFTLPEKKNTAPFAAVRKEAMLWLHKQYGLDSNLLAFGTEYLSRDLARPPLKLEEEAPVVEKKSVPTEEKSAVLALIKTRESFESLYVSALPPNYFGLLAKAQEYKIDKSLPLNQALIKWIEGAVLCDKAKEKYEKALLKVKVAQNVLNMLMKPGAGTPEQKVEQHQLLRSAIAERDTLGSEYAAEKAKQPGLRREVEQCINGLKPGQVVSRGPSLFAGTQADPVPSSSARLRPGE